MVLQLGWTKNFRLRKYLLRICIMNSKINAIMVNQRTAEVNSVVTHLHTNASLRLLTLGACSWNFGTILSRKMNPMASL